MRAYWGWPPMSIRQKRPVASSSVVTGNRRLAARGAAFAAQLAVAAAAVVKVAGICARQRAPAGDIVAPARHTAAA